MNCIAICSGITVGVLAGVDREWKWKPFDKEFDDRFRVLWTVPFECRKCTLKSAERSKMGQDKTNGN